MADIASLPSLNKLINIQYPKGESVMSTFKPTTIIYCIILIISGSGNPQVVVDANGVQKREGLVYKIGQKKPYTGKVIEWSSNGWKWSEKNYKKGEEEGLQSMWYENGKIRSEESYRSGVKEGMSIDYYETGQKQVEGGYISGEKQGHWIWWHPNGLKKEEGNYYNDDPQGLWTAWYMNEQKSFQGNYKYGKRDGLCTWWFENGQKKIEGSFINGKGEGVWCWWHENGQKKVEGSFKKVQDQNVEIIQDRELRNLNRNLEDIQLFAQALQTVEGNKQSKAEDEEDWTGGIKEEFWTWWDENGQKKRVSYYVNGKQTYNKTNDFENTGKPKNESNVNKDEITIECDEVGHKMAEGNYSNGIREGLWKYYYVSGKIKAQGFWSHGRREGTWSSWYENGMMSAEGEYALDKKEGNWITWYESGMIWTEGNWRNDKKIGVWTEFDEKGQIFKLTY
jgi:antitoxin component YwqK of YwqJK toxin-antitoxin module